MPLHARRCALQLRQTISPLWRRFRPSLQDEGIGLARLSVIGQLHRAGTLSPTELAGREGVRIQTLTRLLAGLQADGWVRRAPHPDDRRRTTLSLTAKGRRRLVDAGRAGDAAFAELIAARLSAAECALLQQACALLDRLTAAVDEPAA